MWYTKFMLGPSFSIGTRLMFLVIGVPLGFFVLLKPLWVVNTIGKSSWAEAKMPGGTYGAVKLFGIFIIVLSIITAIG